MLLCFYWNVFKYNVVFFVRMYLIFTDKCCMLIR